MAEDFTAASFYGDDETGNLTGPKGDKGDDGIQGLLGPEGETGIQGRPGKDSMYRYGAFAVLGIQAGEILLDHDVIEGHTLGSNFEGSVASVSIPPEGTWVATVARNGLAVGTITFSIDGVATLATTGASTVSVAARDVITVTAPIVPSVEIGRVRFTFAGQLPDPIGTE